MVNKKREFVLYELWQGKEKVYIGKTNDPHRRRLEHEADKRFTRMKIISPKLTEETAATRETEALEKYKNNHQGKLPMYNKLPK